MLDARQRQGPLTAVLSFARRPYWNSSSRVASGEVRERALSRSDTKRVASPRPSDRAP